MDMVREGMNIGNICRGAVPEVFTRALQDVFINIKDANTNPEQKREVTLTFTFEPSATREVGKIRRDRTTRTTIRSPECNGGDLV
jgi:hypothetical protein